MQVLDFRFMIPHGRCTFWFEISEYLKYPDINMLLPPTLHSWILCTLYDFVTLYLSLHADNHFELVIQYKDYCWPRVRLHHYIDAFVQVNYASSYRQRGWGFIFPYTLVAVSVVL